MQKDRLTHALTMCKAWHEGQVRKSGEPYWTHPVQVMELVKTVPHTEEMLCAALLHDVVEDTECTLQHITNAMGEEVSALVEMLTDPSKPEDGNRAARRAIDRKHSALASREGKTIKIADCIINLSDIVEHDKDFAIQYVKEKMLLLECLRGGDEYLHAELTDLIYKLKKELDIKE